MPNIPLLTEATFERLLNRWHYGIIDGQLLFYSEEHGHYVLTQIKENEEYTVDDYMKLPFRAPFQLIDGKLRMFTTPTIHHQRILGNLAFNFQRSLPENMQKEWFVFRCDVHFDTRNVVQPDFIYVSQSRKHILKDWIMGAPDFLVEIVEQATEYEDTVLKKQLFQKYDVLEYWMVHLKEERVEVYHNHQHQMQLHQVAGINDTIRSIAVEGLVMEVKGIFERDF